MKKFLLSITILLSSFYQLMACGYAPYGEDIRYHLTNPHFFNYEEYNPFIYNKHLAYYTPISKISANVFDWYNFTEKQVSIESIENFMKDLSVEDIHKKQSNKFIQYLYTHQKNSAINYLINAKKYESLNFSNDENWEHKEKEKTDLSPSKLDGLNELKAQLEKEEDSIFKRKYAFLCIRLAYYTENQNALIQTLFNEYFKDQPKDYLYYWSLYFYDFSKNTKDYMVDVANIFSNSPEKTYASYYFFHRKWKKETALEFTENPVEIANIYTFSSIQQKNQALDNLKNIYENSPNHHVLGFLLLRELNKLEDWIFTPYYTNYSPSISGSTSHEKTLLERSEEDRIYAQEVLNFVSNIDLEKVHDVMALKYVQIELLFMTRNYEKCLTEISDFEKQYKEEKCIEQIEKIKTLSLIAKQEKGKTIITAEIQKFILKYKKDNRFVFSVGREFEFNQNLLDGIAIISLINKSEDYESNINWKGGLVKKMYMAYFDDYLEYINFAYPTNNLKQLLVNIKTISISTNFDKLLYTDLVKEEKYLGDLLGTKFIRENKLEDAQLAFESLGEKYWDENYNAWERGQYEYLGFYEHPFYSLTYTEDFIERKDTFVVTKLSLTKQLIHYLALANNPKTKDQDYYYFLVANCYLNMTNTGNSWMMRRFSSWQSSGHVDVKEYYSRKLAQKYYQLAYEKAKTKKFKALCLRMVDYAESKSTRSKRVRKEFPEYFEDLSGCIYFEEFFKARRNSSL